MPATAVCAATINQNGTATLLARVATRDGTGSDSPVATEGTLVKQADLSTITVTVYDKQGTSPTTPILTLTPTVSTVIFDTLQTTTIWGLVAGGGNFLCDLAAGTFASANHQYEVLAKFVTTGGTVGWGHWLLTTVETA